MNYNQVLQYIVQWIRENHNNEITGNILQSVLIEMLQYIKSQDDSFANDITNLQNQIDNITIAENIQVFLGTDNPNVIPPSGTFDAPDIYVKTDTDDLFIFTGSEWLQLTNLPEVNTFISELRIDDLGSIAKSNVVDYINNLTPPYNKVGNENLIISLYEGGDLVQVYWLINNGKGLYGSGQNQISESDLVSFDSNGDMQKATYDPTNVNGDAFDFGNMHNVPDFLEGVSTEDTGDIKLSGDGTVGDALKAELADMPNATDIFARLADGWQPIIRKRENAEFRWVDVVDANGFAIFTYVYEYYDDNDDTWKPSRKVLSGVEYSGGVLGSGKTDIIAIGRYAALNSNGNYINAFGYQAARNSEGSYINAFGPSAALNSKGNDINVFGRNSYSLEENPKCDRVNIFGSNIQPTKSDQNIISGHEFLMPLSTAATVLAAGNKSLTTVEAVKEIINEQTAIIALNHGDAEETVYPVFSNFREDITITSMVLVSRNQVTGQALNANLLINDTVATGTGLTIATSGRTSNEITAGININKGDNIDLDVTQIGSIDTGNNLQLYIKYKKR